MAWRLFLFIASSSVLGHRYGMINIAQGGRAPVWLSRHRKPPKTSNLQVGRRKFDIDLHLIPPWLTSVSLLSPSRSTVQ